MPKKEDYRMALIQALKNNRNDADPAEAARKDFRYLLRLSLDSLVAAGNIAIDHRLPECLSLFAQEIIRTDDGVSFRPELRKLVGDCLDDERLTRDYLDYMKANKAEVDPCVHRLLFPLLGTLLGKRDGRPKTDGEHERSRKVSSD